MRCSKCLMPSFLPGSDFNERGECKWCQSDFPGFSPKGENAFINLVESIYSNNSGALCLVGISGGKDSSFVLSQLKKRFNLRVEAFTYNHFGLTEFALNNAKEVCANLGVKHHVVSLSDNEHLKSFQTFFKIWLKFHKPVPAAMTCVACKHLHTLGSALAAERKIPMIVWSNCPLEVSPVIPLKPDSDKNNHFKRQGMLKSGILMLNELFSTKGFISGLSRHFKTCAVGCLGVTPTSKYLGLRYPSVRQVMFFDYFDWSAEKIVEFLERETGWKKPEGMPDDWHSDCVFNVFKEYMFQKMHRISYTDAFLSNQIRYGLISRDSARAILVKTKKYYAEEILPALEYVGLSNLSGEIDLTCFEVSDI